MARKPSTKESPKNNAPAVTPRPAQVDQGKVIDAVLISAITKDHRNDRLSDDIESVRELADSMSARGLLEPIIVGRFPVTPTGEFLLVAGHRRLAAAKLLGWTEIRAVVREYSCDADLQLDRAVENVHRLELNPVEEAYAVGGMIETTLSAAQQAMADEALASKQLVAEDVEDVRFMAKVRQRAIEMVAGRLGKSVTWVTDRAFLSTLPPPAQELVLEGRLPLNYAREICKVADPSIRSSLAREFAAGGKMGDRPGDFRELKLQVARSLMSLASVSWRLDVAWDKKPACQSCPKNSANSPRLFEHSPPMTQGKHFGTDSIKEPAAGICTDRVCFGEKQAQSNRQLVAKGKSIARRVNDLPKGERPAVTAKAIADLGTQLKVEVPKFIDPGQLATRVKEEMAIKVQPKSKAKTASGSSSYSHPQKSAAQIAREEAWDRHFYDLEARQEKIEKQILQLCAKDPLRKAALAVLAESTLWGQELESQNSWATDAMRDKARKAAQKPGLQQLINLVANPTLEGFKNAGEFLRHDHLSYNGIEPTTDAVDRLAKALGIEVPPRPVFVEPKAEPPAAKEDGPAARAKGKKAAGAKGQEKRHVTDKDLDEFEENE